MAFLVLEPMDLGQVFLDLEDSRSIEELHEHTSTAEGLILKVPCSQLVRVLAARMLFVGHRF